MNDAIGGSLTERALRQLWPGFLSGDQLVRLGVDADDSASNGIGGVAAHDAELGGREASAAACLGQELAFSGRLIVGCAFRAHEGVAQHNGAVRSSVHMIRPRDESAIEIGARVHGLSYSMNQYNMPTADPKAWRPCTPNVIFEHLWTVAWASAIGTST